MSDQVKFHEFMTAELLSQVGLHQKDNNWDLSNIESDWDADMEAQEYDTFEEYKV